MNLDFKQNIILLDTLESTNDYAKFLIKNNQINMNTIIVCNKQTKGRGQRNRVWESEKGKNLLASFIFDKPKIDDSFLINIVSSLSLVDMLSELCINDISIKWPNDILINNRKIAGILIENIFFGNKIKSTIVGFGINVNQIYFPDYMPKATSILLEEKNITPQHLLDHFIPLFEKRYFQAITGDDLLSQYYNLLYAKNKRIKMKINEVILDVVIVGVSKEGKLILDINGQLSEYLNSEIKYLCF